MIVSLDWLKDYVEVTLPVEEIAHRLTMAGLEVEAVRPLYPFLKNVVTGKVLSVQQHPNADRLSVCEVGIGSKLCHIVCGAPNVRAGSIVPVALPGASLASGITIQETRIRGELSQGMLCSDVELGVGEDESGIWILPPHTPVGVPLGRALGIDDVLLDVAVTPNRSDCLSILGIAREVAAACGKTLKYPPVKLEENGPNIDGLSSIKIKDEIGCPRYAARIVQDIHVGPSPAWLRRKLEAVGLRSINNIVDVTNFILMELGQPLHAFDFDLLRERRIVVRRATPGERFTTLDGVERTLFEDTLLICDGCGPVAIAGIMGGLDSEITDRTQNVLIESAFFQPQCIRRTSKKLGLRTESSYRFERGVDPEGVIRALDRAAELMQELAGGRIATGRLDAYPNPMRATRLSLDVEKTNRFLGTCLSAEEMARALRSIELEVKEAEAGGLEVHVPSFRLDITREVDLAEEIARLTGYDQVPVTAPVASIETEPADRHLEMRHEIKKILQGAGFFEVLTYSFVSYEALQKMQWSPEDPRLQPVRIMNPLSEEQSVMRTSLVPGLLQTTRYNLDRGNDDLSIFELGKVFLPNPEDVLPREPHGIAGVMTGRRNRQPLYSAQGEIDFTDVKGVVEALLEPFYLEGVEFRAQDLPSYLDGGEASAVFCEGECLGFLGLLHPLVQEAFDLKKAVYVFDLDFDTIYRLRKEHPRFQALPKFPSVSRDMALIVDESVPVRDPLDFMLGLKEALLEHVDIFDIYRSPQLGEGKKSVAYRLIYRAGERSLTDVEVNELHALIVEKVQERFGAALRS